MRFAATRKAKLMQIGIVGIPYSGKTTVFNAIAGGAAEHRHQTHGLEPTLATVNLRDSRLEALCNLFGPEECIPTEVQYLDFPGAGFGRQEKEAAWVGTLRTVDALLVVLGAFNDVQNPTHELESIHLDLVLPDMQIIENRLQRLALQMRSAPAAERQHLEREQTLLERIQNDLERGLPVRALDLTPEELQTIRGFQLLTLKPTLVIINCSEEQWPRAEEMAAHARAAYPHPQTMIIAICAQLEMEVAQLPPDEAALFREDLGFDEAGATQVVRESHALLGLIHFFTINDKEVRAWAIPQGTKAQDAAGKIHTDMARGFARAEVIAWEQLIENNGYADARKHGLVRQEGRDYVVRDGDVLFILFTR